MCTGGMCDAVCARDSDCPHTGHCDAYSGFCGPPAAQGGGIDAPCDAGTDCRSLACKEGRCATVCSVLRPNCPEDAGCVLIDGGIEEGRCHLP